MNILDSERAKRQATIDRTEPLHGWAYDVERAQHTVNAAKAALANDQQARTTSWWGRVTGWWDTPAKRAVAQAQTDLETTLAQAQARATEWVQQEAQRALVENVPLQAQRSAIKQQLEERTILRNRVAGQHAAATDAMRALEDAARRCRTAATCYTMDAFSSNKGRSMMAYAVNNEARRSVTQAREAMDRLIQQLPQEDVQPLTTSTPDGSLALMWDQVVGGFALDLTNASRLSETARRCDDTAPRLRPMIDRLSSQLGLAQQAVDDTQARLLQIDHDLLQAAWAQVPDLLRGPEPTSLNV